MCLALKILRFLSNYNQINKETEDVVPCVVTCAVAHQVVLCKSLRDTSSRLAELGWLHNKVRKYTDARSLDRAFGLVGQVCLRLPLGLLLTIIFIVD